MFCTESRHFMVVACRSSQCIFQALEISCFPVGSAADSLDNNIVVMVAQL